MDDILIGIAALLVLATPTNGQAPIRPSPIPNFENLVHQAEAARDAKHLGEALALYKRALELKPDWLDGWGNAGSIAYDLEKYAECAADFRRVTALKPDLVPAWTVQGLCEYQLRDYAAALKSLSQVQRLGFQEDSELAHTARLHLAYVLTKLGFSEKAIVWLYQVTKIERKKTPEIVVALGIAGLRKPWVPPEVPESDHDKILKLGDAMATFMVGDTKSAFNMFEAGLREYPREPDFHYRFGAFLVARNLDRGIPEIEKTLELEPHHLPALVAMARIYLRRGQSPTALPFAKEAAEQDPGDITARVTFGQVLLATGDPAGAARELEASVKLAPGTPSPHYILSQAYEKLGRKDDAAREREEFHRLRGSTDPRMPGTSESIGAP